MCPLFKGLYNNIFLVKEWKAAAEGSGKVLNIPVCDYKNIGVCGYW